MTHQDDNDFRLQDERPELAAKLSELEILRQSLESAKAKEKDIFDQLLRLTADFQNFRKRSEARVADARRAGREDVLLPVIALADGLLQAEASTRNATDVEALKRGLSLVREQFDRFLSDQGVKPILSKGEKFDPRRHEAIARVESNDLDEGTVVDEIQRGYTLNDAVIRPSRVSVSARPQEIAQTNSNQEDQNHG